MRIIRDDKSDDIDVKIYSTFFCVDCDREFQSRRVRRA